MPEPSEDVARVLRGASPKKTISFHNDVKGPADGDTPGGPDDGDAEPGHPQFIPSPQAKSGPAGAGVGSSEAPAAGAAGAVSTSGRLPPVQQPVRANRVFTPKGVSASSTAPSTDDAHEPGGKSYLSNIPGPPAVVNRPVIPPPSSFSRAPPPESNSEGQADGV